MGFVFDERANRSKAYFWMTLGKHSIAGLLMGDSPKSPTDLPDSALPQVGQRSAKEGNDLEVFEIAGTIKWFDASKGYGFIIPDNGLTDILLHVTCLRAGGYQTAYE